MNEVEQQTYDLLVKLKPYCTEDEFSLLCWNCGFSTKLFEEQDHAMER